jgi:hypothetical protein
MQRVHRGVHRQVSGTPADSAAPHRVSIARAAIDRALAPGVARKAAGNLIRLMIWRGDTGVPLMQRSSRVR